MERELSPAARSKEGGGDQRRSGMSLPWAMYGLGGGAAGFDDRCGSLPSLGWGTPIAACWSGGWAQVKGGGWGGPLLP